MASPKNSAMPQPIWAGETVTLKDFLMKYEVPAVARVVKGQFMNIGISKFNPLKKLHQDVLVHSIKTGLKILGHSVMRVEGGRDGRKPRLVSLEQRLSIPVTYKGWFELLSEDGRSVRPIESVHQLSKLYPQVNHVLVRQNVKAYLANEKDGKMTFDKTKVVLSGEQLKLTGDFSLQLPPSAEGKVRLLKCTDSKGETLFLSFNQKGLFTPIASETDVMGVFTMKDVIQRFRLPLTVKLVQGVWPKVDSNRFTGIIRLDWAYTDETAFVSPLDRQAPRIYPIPTEVNLRLAAATNNDDLKDNEAYTNIMVKCNRLVSNYHNTIHLIIAVPEGAVKAKSHEFANLYSETASSSLPSERPPSASRMKRAKSREDILMDQLDDLYGYLREGKQPPAGKYARDSDEETFYEEPEFEPMTKFKSRLEMLEKGDVLGSQKNSTYHFIDPRAKFDANHNRISTPEANGHVTSGVKKPAPDLPPRNYHRSGSMPVIQVHAVELSGNGSGGSGSGKEKPTAVHTTKIEHFVYKKSKETQSKQSKGSGSSVEKRDSDSRENKSSKSGSSKQLKSRKSMPLIYL